MKIKNIRLLLVAGLFVVGVLAMAIQGSAGFRAVIGCEFCGNGLYHCEATPQNFGENWTYQWSVTSGLSLPSPGTGPMKQVTCPVGSGGGLVTVSVADGNGDLVVLSGQKFINCDEGDPDSPVAQ